MKTLDANNSSSPNRNTCRICGTSNVGGLQILCTECKRAEYMTREQPEKEKYND